MAAKKGSLSISSENIFPIIKKWVYSDHDIFARELVSNGCDAITKLKKLDMMGEYTLPDDYKGKIQVIVNPEEKTLKFIDNGLGMTADEVEEYITQIAFSGATEFLNKYKDKTTEDDMIGHFGLGFYSAFMVADEVHIDTLSYKEGAKPVHWVSEGGTEYEMEEGSKQEVGSTMTLYLNEDSLEFANEYRMREVLEKYCSFMPVEIFLSKANAEPEYETIDEADLKDDDEVIEHIHEDAKMEEKENERIDIFTKHCVDDVETEINLFDESSGTQKLFGLLPFIAESLITGTVLVIDELDAKIHPVLLRHIIMMFNDMTINRHKAQLIFTSHDLSTMNSEVFRRDEIWFVAKGNAQNSKLYSLVEFKNEKGESVRKDAKFDKQYLEGKYGADPYLRRIIDWGKVNA